jgi:NADPH:quinone reductase-like Zn-dependent oxidoreductase
MRAAIFEAIGKHLLVVDLPDPDPGARDVIIQVGRFRNLGQRFTCNS